MISKKVFNMLIVFVMLVFIMVTNSEAHDINHKSPLSYFPEDITLEEALNNYPEIQNLFPVKLVSYEEAQESIENGTLVINDLNANEMLAVQFLSQLKPIYFNNSKYSWIIGNVQQMRGAWSYSQQNGNIPNCYAYAIGVL